MIAPFASIESLEGRIAPAFASNVHLAALSEITGFLLNGGAAFDYAGMSVARAGDMNGDGFADLIIGAPRADPWGTDSGVAYVVFGRDKGFAPTTL